MVFLFWVRNMDYVDKLRELRIDNDIRQIEIAQVLGCKQSAISKYETRKIFYRVEDIIRLCEFYHVSADYILGLPPNLPYPKRKKQ